MSVVPLPNPIYAVYEVNEELEPISGTYLSAHRTAAQAAVAAAAAATPTGPRLSVRETSIPEVYGYDGPAKVPGTLMEQLAALSAPPKARKPTPLAEPAVWVLTLNGDIGDGVQAVFATEHEAAAHLAGIRAKDMAVDCVAGFFYVSSRGLSPPLLKTRRS